MTTRAQYEARLRRLLRRLRDPKSEQAKGALRLAKSQAMCCLGHACEVSKKGKWEVDANLDFIYRVDILDLSDSIMPSAVRDYFGFRVSDGSWKAGTVKSRANSLVDLNDSLSWSLPRIADFIEAYQANLFTWAGEPS